MEDIILTNNNDKNLKSLLAFFSGTADCIKIASAFFSDTEFILDWLNQSKRVELLISLRPPSNYYSLKKIYSNFGLNIQFLGNNFHSKFYIFFNKGTPTACIIGSSNFTSGGLGGNIETNAILTNIKYLTEIEKHFESLVNQSFSLQPTDLENFKPIFDTFQKKAKQTEEEQRQFQKKILAGRISKGSKVRISKEAKQYFSYCKIVDEIKEIVFAISTKEFPDIPIYITIDQFWNWIKIVWSKKGRQAPSTLDRKKIIPKLFKEYCYWDKSNENYTKDNAKTSKIVFATLLSEKNINKLSKAGAKKIYGSLHSGAMTTRRFGADEKFVTENSIEAIRKSLIYLLYSNDEVDLRIHQLCKAGSPYKLKQLKSSGVQELIGWVNPAKYPIRNDKSDDALKLLGFDLELYS